MNYEFKRDEIAWFVLVAVVTVLMEALLDFDPATITDWSAWAVGLGAASVRATAAAILTAIARATR